MMHVARDAHARGRSSAARRFVLLDRDGTLIVERHYLADPEAVELVPGAADGLRALQAAGWGLAVVTNQSGIARGYFDAATLARIHDRLAALLAAEGVTLDGVYHCPHAPADGCDCRKPAPGLVHAAARAHGFDPSRCVMVGDNACDVELGRAVGATTILVRTGYGARLAEEGRLAPDHVVADLGEAAALILRHG